MAAEIVGNPFADELPGQEEHVELLARGVPSSEPAAGAQFGSGPSAPPPVASPTAGAAYAPPMQQSIGAGFDGQELMGMHRQDIEAQLPKPEPRAELTSGPHLRSTVLLFFVVLLFVTHFWAPQAAIIPFMFLATTSTNALWCMPGELIISLGPIPTCFLRRRISYDDIESITEVRGRLHTVTLLLRRMLRIWQPLGFCYGLTLGKELVEVSLASDAQKEHGIFMGPSILISVDQAEDVISHVLFRQKHGAEAPLPASMARSGTGQAGQKVKWVVLDAFDMLLSLHARNSTACDIFGFILAPISAFVESQRNGTGDDERDHSL